MSNGAPLTFTPFVSDETFFVTREAANQFFSDIRVPPATAIAYGSVKLVNFPSAIATADVDEEAFYVQVLQGDMSYVTAQVPSFDSHQSLVEAFDELQTKYNTLIDALKISGIIA